MISTSISWLKKRHIVILFAVLFFCHIFFLSYQFVERSQFTWDQVDNAWNAKNIIVNHQFPLLGMQARQGTGIYMGPFYYYYITFFYLLTNLDPIASPIAALVTGVLTFFAMWYVSKRIFSTHTALVITFIYTFSFAAIQADRVQWPVAFVPLVSVFMLYALYQVVLGKAKYIFFVFFLLGLSFQIHFTSIFYILILLACLPLYPRTKKFAGFALLGMLMFLLWMSPVIAAMTFNKSNHVSNLFSFLSGSSNGLHLRRVIQIYQDGFTEFSALINLPFSNFYSFIMPLLFGIVYYLQHKSKESIKLLYLIGLWIVIPWVGLATYKGELSNYFFTITRPVAIFCMGYLIFWLYRYHGIISRFVVIGYLLSFVWVNTQLYFSYHDQGLAFYEKREYSDYKKGLHNIFLYGAPESYLYYFYQRKFGIL